MLVTYKIGEVYFRSLVQMVFMQRQRFTAARSRCRQNLKNGNLTSRQTLHRKAYSTIIFHHSTNQIIYLWCRRCSCDFFGTPMKVSWCEWTDTPFVSVPRGEGRVEVLMDSSKDLKLHPFDTPVKQASNLHALGARWTAGMRGRALQC